VWSSGAVLALALACSPLRATEIRTAAQEASSPKFIALGPDGKTAIVGLCVDIMRAIERVDPDIVFVGEQRWQPLARIEAGIAQGQLDAACGFFRTREREAKFDYIAPELYTMNFFLAARADDPVQVKNWDDVRQLGNQGSILMIHGSGMVGEMEKLGGVTIDSGGRDSEINLAKLLAGRGRFYFHRSPGIQEAIARAGMQDRVRLLPTVMRTENFYMIVSKKLPAAARDKIRNAIVKLRASGELARLFRQWDDAPEISVKEGRHTYLLRSSLSRRTIRFHDETRAQSIRKDRLSAKVNSSALPW
jgi:ABC-type amino acid transport substrate-binding protein